MCTTIYRFLSTGRIKKSSHLFLAIRYAELKILRSTFSYLLYWTIRVLPEVELFVKLSLLLASTFVVLFNIEKLFLLCCFILRYSWHLASKSLLLASTFVALFNIETYEKRPTKETYIYERFLAPREQASGRILFQKLGTSYQRDLWKETYKRDLYIWAILGTSRASYRSNSLSEIGHLLPKRPMKRDLQKRPIYIERFLAPREQATGRIIFQKLGTSY